MDRMLPVTVLQFNTTPPIPHILCLEEIAGGKIGGSGFLLLELGRGVQTTMSSWLKSLVEIGPHDAFLSPLLGKLLLPGGLGPFAGWVTGDLSFALKLSNLP